MSAHDTPESLSVGMILFDGVTQLDLTGPYEVFSRMPNTTVRLVASSPEPVRTEWGMRISPDATFDTVPALDILCVPGGWGINDVLDDEALLDFLRGRAPDASHDHELACGHVPLVPCSGRALCDGSSPHPHPTQHRQPSRYRGERT